MFLPLRRKHCDTFLSFLSELRCLGSFVSWLIKKQALHGGLYRVQNSAWRRKKETFMISVKQRSQNTDSLFLETFVIKSFKFFDILLTT